MHTKIKTERLSRKLYSFARKASLRCSMTATKAAMRMKEIVKSQKDRVRTAVLFLIVLLVTRVKLSVL